MSQTVLFLVFSIHCSLGQNPLEAQAKQLLSLLDSPVPAKGDPWPDIPGPNLNDRVCVVGAGASGIHMAMSLKKRNYENVVVFEKSSRIGGKCYDINYRGTPNAQGANYLEANYFNEDSLVPVLREYGLDDLVPVPSTHIWTTNSASDPGSKLTPAQFALGTVSKFTNSTSPEVNLGFYLQTVVRYIKLHQEMFGSYEGDLMQKPSPDVMHRIRGTILDFLKRENLLGMTPIFQITGTLAGYGHMDEVAALYFFIWHNPKLVLTVALTAIKQNKKPFALFSLKKGYENVWKTIAEKDKLNVRFKTDITSIERKSDGVYLNTYQNHKARSEFCDFVVWTPEGSELMRTLDKPTREEIHLLGSLTPEVFYAHLINIKGGIRHAPTTAFMTNVLGKEDFAVTWTADTAGLLTPGIKTPEGMEKYNNAEGVRTLYALHAPSKRHTKEAFLKKKMRNHFINGFNVTSIEFLNTIAWSYFPRWTPEQVLEGRHWDYFKMQGQNRIWYAGVSASYESVRSVVSYNNRLLNQMVPRSRQPSNPKLKKKFKGTSSSINVKDCQYSCSSSGSCKVQYVGTRRSGYTLGFCWSGRSACDGTPKECQECNTVIQC